VLDEATANIDTTTELALQQSVDSISQNHTVIVIAHRISTIVNSDIIVVMKKGKVKECGSHGELYARMAYIPSCLICLVNMPRALKVV
jgi:ABC-type multidrug transport system fused ATPase/permease subunit